MFYAASANSDTTYHCHCYCRYGFRGLREDSGYAMSKRTAGAVLRILLRILAKTTVFALELKDVPMVYLGRLACVS